MKLSERITNALMRTLFRLFFKMDLKEFDKVPKDGPFMIIANHTSALDGPLMYVFMQPRQMIAMAKQELWNHGFVQIRESFVAGSDVETINTQINEIMLSYTARMIAAKTESEFNELLSSFLADAEGLGLSQIEDYYTQQYLKYCEAQGVTPWVTLDSQVDITPYVDITGLDLVR